MTYSGGSANRYTYALELLNADTGSDLPDLRSRHKSITPVLTFFSVEGKFGPGHNSFFTNEEELPITRKPLSATPSAATESAGFISGRIRRPALA